MDYGHIVVDEELKRLEKRLHKEYKQALVELKAKANAYFQKFQEQDKIMLAKMNANDITYKEYIEWRKNKMFMTEHYNRMVDDMAHNLTHTNEIAASMIDKTLPSAYAENYNYAGYEVCKGMNMNISFELVDTHTVERLVKDNPQLLPKPRVNIPKDLRWNQKKLNSALMQGILQGDSIPHIADRLQGVTDMSRNAAIRNARTMTTGAESAGRINRYREARDMGIEVKKKWLATMDGRTRDWHVELDGQTVGVEEYFVNSLGEIFEPGDPGADPANVYNCRCALVSETANITVDYSVREMAEELGDITYDEWKEQAHERAKNSSTVKRIRARSRS